MKHAILIYDVGAIVSLLYPDIRAIVSEYRWKFNKRDWLAVEHQLLLAWFYKAAEDISGACIDYAARPAVPRDVLDRLFSRTRYAETMYYRMVHYPRDFAEQEVEVALNKFDLYIYF